MFVSAHGTVAGRYVLLESGGHGERLHSRLNQKDI